MKLATMFRSPVAVVYDVKEPALRNGPGRRAALSFDIPFGEGAGVHRDRGRSERVHHRDRFPHAGGEVEANATVRLQHRCMNFIF